MTTVYHCISTDSRIIKNRSNINRHPAFCRMPVITICYSQKSVCKPVPGHQTELLSQNNTDQCSAALVDDALQCLLQLADGFGRQAAEFFLHAFLRDRIDRLPENVGLPELLDIAVKALQQEAKDLTRGVLSADLRRYLCLDIGLEHVNGFGAGLEPDAVAPTLADDLRLCQLQISGRRHDDPIALAAHVL